MQICPAKPLLLTHAANNNGDINDVFIKPGKIECGREIFLEDGAIMQEHYSDDNDDDV